MVFMAIGFFVVHYLVDSVSCYFLKSKYFIEIKSYGENYRMLYLKTLLALDISNH